MKVGNSEVIGIRIPEEKDQFLMNGCDNCQNGLGCEVVSTKVYTKQTEWKNYYPIKLCHSCLCAYYNGDPLSDYCKNVFEI